MKIENMIRELTSIKEEYGNLEVVGADSYDLDDVKVQKYIKTSSDHNDIITTQTENMDENSLEKMYLENKDYNNFL